jgi:para-nitrobenzyl esterase
MKADNSAPSRRTVLGAAVSFGGALGMGQSVRAEAASNVSPQGKACGGQPAPHIVTTPASLIVQTEAGRVRGFVSDGIATFKGIPYGDCSQRFMPPRPPVSWPGVRTCFSYGPICPQPQPTGLPSDTGRFYGSGESNISAEDCLRANVWTPAVGDGRKRPVLVWIHGGGFNSGSSHESACHGESISRRGNIVVVSFNHRLNALGFLNLADFGADYASSANAGLLDLVLALEWVRDTITQFGGDPGNVTLMGQSGGGRKISTLLAMPAAHGLFHKAIIHSGSLLTVSMPEQTGALAHETLSMLSLARHEVGQLAKIPPMALIDAYNAATVRLTTPSSTVFDFPYTGPTLDGKILPVQPFDDAAPSLSRQVPMLVGTCLHEQSAGRSTPQRVTMSDGEMRALLTKDYGSSAESVIAVFRKAHSRASPYEIFSLIQSVSPRRPSAVQQVTLKAAQRAAPAYNFQFAWCSPMLDGAPLAHHGSDLPFAFYNIDRSVNATGGGPDARRLAERMCDAWIAFVRHGDPNTGALPHWPPVTPGALPTMIFDSKCKLVYDHDRAERALATVVPESLRHL